VTGEALPAARLPFGGRTLLEGLIRDLQAREYLYYKLYGKQLETPVAMMTSQEKNNHQHIQSICSENDQFGRHPERFLFFMQPLSPVITIEGNWSLSSAFNLTMKPGGHGVIWKLAVEQGIFSQLEAQGRTRALVRQINNPMAGIDQTVLSFTGYGLANNKTFGFASCPRLLNTAEGMNVLLERNNEGKNGKMSYSAGITNIEYTVFAHHGLKDQPCSPGSPFSAFPANTNILFVELNAVREAVHHCPFPGKNINMKHKVPSLTPEGTLNTIESGRLETTMQNISEALLDTLDHPVETEEHHQLKTYITYHDRLKTISVTKKSYTPGCSLVETPEGCFYDLQRNYRDLLVNICHVEMPEINSEADFVENGPAFIVQFHPALGPLFSIIGQKIRGGRLAPGSELQLEIAEVDIENLDLEGSLRIVAESVTGRRESDGILRYGEQSGKCVLHNVRVVNSGINRGASNSYWKNWILHDEVLSIVLRGNGEFYAENVTFSGRAHLEVQDGTRVIATQEGEEISFRTEKISASSWSWSYQWDQQDRIRLEKR
jgi:UTP---glucose-1-phosphate uridylyltransferase